MTDEVDIGCWTNITSPAKTINTLKIFKICFKKKY